ncbi:MAG: hypothetical protein ABIN57_08710 [Chitinophagaceae bacterium]
MVKRTKGYLLLILLVLTGLASQVPRATLSGRDRKDLVTQLKESKAQYLQNIKGLTPNQLTFKATGKLSILHWMQRQAIAEQNLWLMADTALKNTNEENHFGKSQNSALPLLGDKDQEVLNERLCRLMKTMNAEKVELQFVTNRANVIKYVKTTTDDPAHHFAQTPLGAVSIRQIISNISSNTDYYNRQIKEVKSQPGYPK